MANFKLVVVGGDAQANETVLDSLPALIGRGREADIRLAHPLVSRLHCELYLHDGVLHVRDLGSLNGTFVGNLPIKSAKLPHGELLTIGTVTFRAVEVEQETPAQPVGDITELPVDDDFHAEPSEHTMAVGPGESTISTKKDPALRESAESATERAPKREDALGAAELTPADADLQDQDTRVAEGQNLPVDDA